MYTSDKTSDLRTDWDRMHLRKKKKKESIDPTTKRLLDQGIINIDSPRGYGKKKSATKKLKELGMVTYDFWSGVKYILGLSMLLWWLPLFGPMLAGYVGGRRTGGPKKGLLAAILSLGIIGGIHYMFLNNLMPSQFSVIMSAPSIILSSLAAKPFLAPYVEFLRLYWSAFFTSVLGGLPYTPNSYIITAIFAYIGGIITVDKEREYARAENKEKPSITINLSQLSSRLNPTSSNSGFQGAQKSDAGGVKSRNPRSWNANAAKGQNDHLNDLKKIQFKKMRKAETKGKSGEKSPPLTGSSSEKKVMKKKDKSEKKIPKRPVKHHSANNDDWELL